MRLAFIIIAYESFHKLKPLLSTLLHNDDIVVLHYDLSINRDKDIELIKELFPSVIFAQRVSVEWGEPSIVHATLNSLKALIDSGERFEYVSLISGSCFPCQNREALGTFLKGSLEKEYIECVNVSENKWVTEGLEWERWEHFHIFNWRKNPKLFSYCNAIQKKLRIKRKIPLNYTMYMGSQWWTLSKSMVQKILELTKKINLHSFIRNTWIPDEFFFQTMVGNLIENPSNLSSPLMEYKFNKIGIPKVYSDSDIKTISELNNKFLIRKIKHGSTNLIDFLSDIYKGNEKQLNTKDSLFPIEERFRWFKKHCYFNDQWGHCPIPIIIFKTNKQDKQYNLELKNKIKKILPDISVYGELFNAEQIDYNDEQPLVLYSKNNTKLRDYDYTAFTNQLGLKSNYGYMFNYCEADLECFVEPLKYNENVLVLELLDFSKSNFDVIELSRNHVRNYNYSHMKYYCFDLYEIEKIIALVSKHYQDNIYLKAVKAVKA